MPIKLHPDCRKRVIEAATAGIPRIATSNGMFLERFSCLLAFFECEAALPEKGQLHDQLVAYVDDTPLLTFFMSVIERELRERDKYLGDTPKIKLVELDGYSDPAQLAERLVTQFESLPWTYTWSVKLPNVMAKFLCSFLSEISLSPRLRIVCPDSDMDKRFPLESANPERNKRIHEGNGLLGVLWPNDKPEWEKDGAYLQAELDGYIGEYGGTLPADEATRVAKSVFGLGLALRLFEVDYSIGSGPMSESRHIYVHRRVGNVWEIDNKIRLIPPEPQALSTLRFHDLDGKLDNDQKKIAWAKSKLDDIAAVFSGGLESGPILLASQWLFDSYMGTDQLLSFVQAMIVLEILFGDKAASEEVGLTQLLRNRCAYLIGDTHTSRAEILNDFSEIYKVRSKIVHQGQHRLDARERVLFNKLRWMCRRAIYEETKLLRATVEERKNKDTS